MFASYISVDQEVAVCSANVSVCMFSSYTKHCFALYIPMYLPLVICCFSVQPVREGGSPHKKCLQRETEQMKLINSLKTNNPKHVYFFQQEVARILFILVLL